jgi:hypothetical protein
MKLKFSPILILLALMCSCSKEDNKTETFNPAIIDPVVIAPNINPTGIYLLTAFNTSFPTNLNGDTVSSTNQMAETSCYDNYLLDLKSDGTFTNDNRISLVTGSAPSSNLVCEQKTTLAGNYTVAGNIITLKFINGTTANQELKLTSSENKILKSEILKSMFISNTFNGSYLSARADVEYVYTKKT